MPHGLARVKSETPESFLPSSPRGLAELVEWLLRLIVVSVWWAEKHHGNML